MYDELLKRIRNRRICIQQSGGLEDFPLLKEAAYAIEELNILAENGETTYDIMVRQTSYIEELQKKIPRWIPVTERLPEKNQIVVVVQHGKTWDYGRFRGLAYLGGNIHKWNWENNTTKTVDYWMPKQSALPEPPEEES